MSPSTDGYVVSDFAVLPGLTLEGSRRALGAALEYAEGLGVRVVVAVTDRAGCLLTLARMDGAFTLSVEVAQKKAATVCATAGAPTADLWRMFKDDPQLLHGLTPQVEGLMPVSGGVPFIVDGELAGAIGVSGATAVQDAEIAAAGVRAVSPR